MITPITGDREKQSFHCLIVRSPTTIQILQFFLFLDNIECTANKVMCYTSQLKCVFRLEENVSRVMGQNSLTPKGNNNFRPIRDQVVLLETATNL